jgi:hypothetical protein
MYVQVILRDLATVFNLPPTLLLSRRQVGIGNQISNSPLGRVAGPPLGDLDDLRALVEVNSHLIRLGRLHPAKRGLSLLESFTSGKCQFVIFCTGVKKYHVGEVRAISADVIPTHSGLNVKKRARKREKLLKNERKRMQN